MVASVPLLTSRTCSTGADPLDDGLGQLHLVRAGRAEGLVPLAACAWIAATTSGWAWPRIIGPQEPTRSTYSSAVRIDDVRALRRRP